MSILSKIIKSPDLMSAVDKAMKKVTDEVVKRDKAGGPISGREIGSDPYGYFSGYPVSDLLANLPANERQIVLVEMRKMALIRPGVGGLGGVVGVGGGGGGGGIGGITWDHMSKVTTNHVDMLCMRMRWNTIHQTPFEDVYVFVVSGNKVFKSLEKAGLVHETVRAFYTTDAGRAALSAKDGR